MRKADLERFKKLLLQKRAQLTGNVSQMQDETLKGGGQDVSVDHMADHGSDNFEQDFTLGLIENEQETIREIDDALEKIEAGTYGACEECDQSVPVPRLRVIPWARLCVECQRSKETEG
ncbi:MAG: TraR/DksA C4-type zinc finger protein [Planctomycetota bacterium]